MLETLIASAIIWTGIATYYSDYYEGRRTASKQIFTQSKLTLARPGFGGHPYKVKVTNWHTGISSDALVNDGCNCSADFAKALTRKLNGGKLGNIKVIISRI